MKSTVQTTNAAIYYQPDGFDTSRDKLMGRHAAGEEFLKAWARYSDAENLFCYSKGDAELKDFLKRIHGHGPAERKNVWIPWQRWQGLQVPGCLFVPGPGLGPMAYQRRYMSDSAFSLCGITHTTASDGVMDALGELLLAPTQRWDALICTSRSVQQMVMQVLESYAEYFKERFCLIKAPKIPLQLPVIPLGVDCSSFDKTVDEKASVRKEWRDKLGISEDDFVALYVGRLSFHAKAHPMPMYLGLEKAAKETGKNVCLIMAGWFANDSIKNEFIAAARAICPSVKVLFLDGRKTAVRKDVWYVPDVFTSLSDNIQETFGLTPIEAMAAGLPVVVSDWDGYRETVRNGVDGFLIPTWMSGPGKAQDLAFLNATNLINYDHYIGCQSQFTAVDVESTAKAFSELIRNDALRLRMGTAAKQRANDTYDWKLIVRSYEDLFKELAGLRTQILQSEKQRKYLSPQPLRQDPTVLFQGYPSEVLLPQTTITAKVTLNVQSENALALSMNNFAIEKLGLQTALNSVITTLMQTTPCNISRLRDRGREEKHSEIAIDRSVLWLAKMGLVEFSN